MASPPTIVTVPCFSGAPWELERLTPLAGHPLQTMRLPDELDDIEAYADVVAEQVVDLDDDYVLVGDSFGAVIALAVATRRPEGLRALVLSGGFAANPVDHPVLRAKIAAARYLPGPLYRHVTLRLHAASLASPHDGEGQVIWTRADSRKLFVRHTPHRTYVRRAAAALAADYRDRLPDITVPTLILTPSHDQLIGKQAATTMREAIPDATEIVLERTGHMLRFTHPKRYAHAVQQFLSARGLSPARDAAAHA